MKIYIGKHLGSNLAMTWESENVANNLKIKRRIDKSVVIYPYTRMLNINK